MHWGVSSVEEDRAVPSLDVDAAETITFRYDVDDDESPSRALVTVLAAVTATGPTELGPLGWHVDLEAMDQLVASSHGGTALSATVLLDAEGLSLGVGGSEIVGVARRDVTGLAPDGS